MKTDRTSVDAPGHSEQLSGFISGCTPAILKIREAVTDFVAAWCFGWLDDRDRPRIERRRQSIMRLSRNCADAIARNLYRYPRVSRDAAESLFVGMLQMLEDDEEINSRSDGIRKDVIDAFVDQFRRRLGGEVPADHEEALATA